MIEHYFVESRIKEHLMLAINASSWATELLSPRSYHNTVVEQQRSHKDVSEKIKHSSSKMKRQLNVRARYYSKVCVSECSIRVYCTEGLVSMDTFITHTLRYAVPLTW